MDNRIIEKMFKDRAEIGEGNACWNWVGHINKRGHPIMKHKIPRPARRISFELYIGEILQDRVGVFVTCGNELCVNPNHLELRCLEQILKSTQDKGREKTFCKRGHTLEGAFVKGSGKRWCLTCMEEHYKKKKEKYVAHPLSSRSHCRRGHSLDDAIIRKNGVRLCRGCDKLRRERQKK